MQFDQVGYIYQKNTPFAREGLKGINWSITEPNMLALVGETGSGKSTLAQHLNGLLKPTSGVYSHGEIQITTLYKKGMLGKLRQEIGLVFQTPEKQLFHETVQDELLYGPMNFGYSQTEALSQVTEALRQVDLPIDFLSRKIETLSGGEKRRVAIASVLSMQPRVLVLDEPTAGLDPTHKVQIMEMLRLLFKHYQITIIWVTHDMDDVLLYAKELVILSQGRVMHAGQPAEIFQAVDVASYGLVKPRVIQLKDELAEKFGIQLPSSMTDLEKILQCFVERYRSDVHKKAGDQSE